MERLKGGGGEEKSQDGIGIKLKLTNVAEVASLNSANPTTLCDVKEINQSLK